jgi:hypothetical protein
LVARAIDEFNDGEAIVLVSGRASRRLQPRALFVLQ